MGQHWRDNVLIICDCINHKNTVEFQVDLNSIFLTVSCKIDALENGKKNDILK